MRTDEDVWNMARPVDLWLMDKLILAKRLGYTCGPKGVDVPKPGKYMIRPIVNAMGMGLGAHSLYLKDSTDDIPNGYFWCEFFEGPHVSVDYFNGKERLYVRGYRDPNRFDRWEKWEVEHFKTFPLPSILEPYLDRYESVNIEAIGGKVIEVHLRPNPDFVNHNSPYVIPTYKNTGYVLSKYQEFIEAPDGQRTGFIIERR